MKNVKTEIFHLFYGENGKIKTRGEKAIFEHHCLLLKEGILKLEGSNHYSTYRKNATAIQKS